MSVRSYWEDRNRLGKLLRSARLAHERRELEKRNEKCRQYDELALRILEDRQSQRVVE